MVLIFILNGVTLKTSNTMIVFLFNKSGIGRSKKKNGSLVLLLTLKRLKGYGELLVHNVLISDRKESVFLFEFSLGILQKLLRAK